VKVAARVAVVRFPGGNCERETLRALERTGLGARIVRWNEPTAELLCFDAYVLPGGFSYQDRIRAGAVAARLPLLEVVGRRAREGAPVLGICNGAQILVEAGLVPGGDGDPVRLALAANRIERRDGYYTRWIFLAPGPSAEQCLFTRGLDEPLPMPMAHGEGRFTSSDSELPDGLVASVALRYARADGTPAGGFPANPNGSRTDAAGLMGGDGNVLAIMPHPERAQDLAQVPEWLDGTWGDRRRAAGGRGLDGDGPGLRLFQALARTLGAGRD
jgi:phosphoribosylformylglycinamidine synthase subunit PurQ / glutaminase